MPKNTEEIETRLLGERDAARILGISPRTLRTIRRGEHDVAHAVPHVQIGHTVRYDRCDLDAFIEANKHAPATASA